MRRRTILAMALVAAAIAPAPSAAADDSVFGIRGLGLMGRPLSARAAGAGGAFALFDPGTALNPSALGLFRSPAGWAVSASSWWRYDGGASSAALGSTRFPLFGFASPVGRKLTVSFAVSDYLDRSWAVRTTKDTVLRSDTVTFEDEARSSGGVSDLRLGAAYTVSPVLTVGAGLHVLSGSTRLSVERTFTMADSSATYVDYSDLAVTDFSGWGASVGAQLRIGNRMAASATARVNSRLKAAATNGATARVSMPAEFSAGLMFAPAARTTVALSVGRQTWERAADDLEAAGQERSRSVWSVAVGGEYENAPLLGGRFPVRAGYRWRQLPFRANGATLDERAFSAGIGFSFAEGRAVLDVGVDSGRRSAGATSERFTTAFVGVTIRP